MMYTFCMQFGNTALHEAAWNGNNDVVKMLLNAFCFVDSINNTGFTPLLLASQNGHAKVVKTLLKWKADPLLVNQVCSIIITCNHFVLCCRSRLHPCTICSYDKVLLLCLSIASMVRLLCT